MTLSRWLRDYVYISLGGNRDGPTRRDVNLFLTMLLGGLWHGAAWTFVVWGALQGVGLVVERRIAERRQLVGRGGAVPVAAGRPGRGRRGTVPESSPDGGRAVESGAERRRPPDARPGVGRLDHLQLHLPGLGVLPRAVDSATPSTCSAGC